MGNSNSQPDITNSAVLHDRGDVLKSKEVNRKAIKSSAKESWTMKIQRKRSMKVVMKGEENAPSQQSTSTAPEKLQMRQDLQSPAPKQGPHAPTTPLSQKTQKTCPDSVELLSLDSDDCSENEVFPTSVMNINPVINVTPLLKDAPKRKRGMKVLMKGGNNAPSQQSTRTAPEKLQEYPPAPKQGPQLPKKTTSLSQKTQKTCADSVELLSLDSDDCSKNEVFPTSVMNINPLFKDAPSLPSQATEQISSTSFSDRAALINANKRGSDTMRTENGEDLGLTKLTNDMHASFTALAQEWKSSSTINTSCSDMLFPTEPVNKRLFHENDTEVEDSLENDGVSLASDSLENDDVSLASESDRHSLGDLEKPERKQELDELDQIIDSDDVDDLLHEVSLASESGRFSFEDSEKPRRGQKVDELDQIIDDRDVDGLLNDDFDQLMNELDFEETNDQHHVESRLPDIAENEENDDEKSLGSNSMFSHSDCSDYGSLGPTSISGRSIACSVGDISLTPSTAQKLKKRRESQSHGLHKGVISTSCKKLRPSKPNATNAFETLPRHLIKTSLLRQAASTLRDERFLNRRITKLGAVYAAKVHVSDFVCMASKLFKDAEKREEERTSLEAAMPSSATFADGEDVESVTIDSFEIFEKCILELCGIQMVDFDVSGVDELRETDGTEEDDSDEIGDDKIISPKVEQIKQKISLDDGGRALYSLGKYCQKADWNDDAMHFYKHALYLYLLDVGVEESRLLDNSDDCDGFFYINVARSCVHDSSHTHQYLASIFTKMGDVHGKCDEKNDALRAYRASEVFWRKHISDLQLDDNADNADNVVAAVEALALSFNRIGGVYTAKGELDAALAALHEGLKMQIDTLGDSHIEVAKTLHNIGVCHRHNDDWDSALEYYIQAHEIFEFSLGRDHLDTVRTLHNIGGVYRRKKEYLNAMECFKEVLLVRRHALGDDHPSVSITLVSMAAVLRRCGKKEEANKFYLAAVH